MKKVAIDGLARPSHGSAMAGEFTGGSLIASGFDIAEACGWF